MCLELIDPKTKIEKTAKHPLKVYKAFLRKSNKEITGPFFIEYNYASKPINTSHSLKKKLVLEYNSIYEGFHSCLTLDDCKKFITKWEWQIPMSLHKNIEYWECEIPKGAKYYYSDGKYASTSIKLVRKVK